MKKEMLFVAVFLIVISMILLILRQSETEINERFIMTGEYRNLDAYDAAERICAEQNAVIPELADLKGLVYDKTVFVHRKLLPSPAWAGSCFDMQKRVSYTLDRMIGEKEMKRCYVLCKKIRR